MEWQQTIEKTVSYTGIGLHLGRNVKVSLEPAPPNQGIIFVREDLPGSPSVKAAVSRVVGNERGTTIGEGEVRITTVEHILAALSGMGVDNVTIRMDSQEFPVGDGSALTWVESIESAGTVVQDTPREFFKIKKPYYIQDNDRQLVVLPYDGFKITYMVDFPQSPLQSQFAEFVIGKDTFIHEIAPSRTFGFMREVKYLQDKGLIQGGSLDNAVVIDEQGVVNKEGLRFPNEPVRHKILDLIGDLCLIGRPIKAHVMAVKAGHLLHVRLAKELEQVMSKENNKAKSLNICEIKKILPHRYPFLLVDKILAMRDKEIVGVKNFTINEPFFAGHFPGNPVVPAALTIEAMAQVAGIYLLSITENQGKLAYFAGIDKARFRKPVMPGDKLVSKVKILSLRKVSGRYLGKVEATGFVQGEKVAEAFFLFGLVER